MKRIFVTAVTACLCMAGPTWAAPRSTPVQVVNLLGIDPNNNTVKAQQLGTWTVNVANTLSANLVNSPTIKLDSTSNVVKIDGTANTVAAPTQYKQIKLWNGDQTIPASGILDTAFIDCKGYKEIRVALGSTTLGASASFFVDIWLDLPYGGTNMYGSVSFATPTGSITQGPAFIPTAGRLLFTMPVMAERCLLRFRNNTGSPQTLSDVLCWVYLVN